jgi:hypothetical protein
METHRFTVNVANPNPAGASVELRLQRVTPADVAALSLDVPDGELEVTSAGISRNRGETTARKLLNVELAPYASVDVHVDVSTANASPGSGGTAAFNLVDVRRRKRVGGVMVVCVQRAGPERAGQDIPASKACPVVLARKAYAVAPGSDPGQAPANNEIPAMSDVELVAPITNPRKGALRDVEVYLEHVGLSDATFAPRTWNVGALAPNEVFFAAWPLHTTATPGPFDASVVVKSRGKQPVRLSAQGDIARVRRGGS